MKPFDLEAAKAGAKIVTRNGKDVKFLLHLPDIEPDSRVVALVNNIVHTYGENGKLYADSPYSSELDLFLSEEKKTIWINYYGPHSWSTHSTKELADYLNSGNRIGEARELSFTV